MKNVKLNAGLLVNDTHHDSGDVIAVTDQRAAELIRLGHAQPSDGDAASNAGHNPLADCIDPEPPGGLIVNPVDSLSPNVEDNPGLRKAVDLAGPSARVKSAKIKPDAARANPSAPGVDTEPTTTANEVATETGAR